MTTRAQDNAVEQLSLARGGESLAIRDGFTDEHIDVTARGGACWHVNAEGVARKQAANHSIRWTETAARVTRVGQLAYRCRCGREFSASYSGAINGAEAMAHAETCEGEW